MAFKRIQPQELDALVSTSSRSIILDVRDDDYDAGGHYQRSINIPVSNILEGKKEVMTMLDQYDPIICYCMLSQQRGPAAARSLCAAFPQKRIYVVTGGFTAMLEHYGPLGQIIGYAVE